jgi:hypothetical protein
MGNFLNEYFRLPESLLGSWSHGELGVEKRFFRFGPDTVCYGQCQQGISHVNGNEELYDATEHVAVDRDCIYLPFDPGVVVDNLRLERYRESLPAVIEGGVVKRPIISKGYYAVRELLPVSVRRHLQKIYFRDWKRIPFPKWPVDCTVDSLHWELLRLLMKAKGINRLPFIWFWPEGAPSCLIMTHDVETTSGVRFSPQLMDIDEAHGLKASFQVVPEDRYEFSDDFVRCIRDRGFEFNIHDLNHDGQLFKEHKEFLRRVARINEYAERYGARGFRSGAMYRNQDWFQAFAFSYDLSVPTVAHLEPMRGGCCTVMPYFVGKILELPLTTSQDYTVLHILDDPSIDLWRRQIDLIRQRNGLISFISHPDYLIEKRSRNVYVELLQYLKQLVDRESIWTPLPGALDEWWRARSKMQLVPQGTEWKIEGPQSERARIAFAELKDDHLAWNIPA